MPTAKSHKLRETGVDKESPSSNLSYLHASRRCTYHSRAYISSATLRDISPISLGIHKSLRRSNSSAPCSIMLRRKTLTSGTVHSCAVQFNTWRLFDTEEALTSPFVAPTRPVHHATAQDNNIGHRTLGAAKIQHMETVRHRTSLTASNLTCSNTLYIFHDKMSRVQFREP